MDPANDGVPTCIQVKPPSPRSGGSSGLQKSYYAQRKTPPFEGRGSPCLGWRGVLLAPAEVHLELGHGDQQGDVLNGGLELFAAAGRDLRPLRIADGEHDRLEALAGPLDDVEQGGDAFTGVDGGASTVG